MTSVKPEAWLNQLERRAHKRRQNQLVRLLIVIAADCVLVALLIGAIAWHNGGHL